MLNVKVDGLNACVPEGSTLLEAAESVFVDIPTLCYLKEMAPEVSCMLCVVKDVKRGQLVPACSVKAAEGMEIDTVCAEVQQARREILNLLLSEHVGDCEAPCRRICPAHLDIARMLREIERGHVEKAAQIARRDLAIPWVLGHICPAPCEKGCRRGLVDEALQIGRIHRELAGDFDGERPALNGKKVAVIGSGPAGLAAAWQLQRMGYGCTVFDDRPVAGGVLADWPEDQLPKAVLAAEIEQFKRAGIVFELGHGLSMHEISSQFEGILFAESTFSGVHFEDAFYAEEHRLAVKAVANGKAAAQALDRFLRGERPDQRGRFDSKIGALRGCEVNEFLKSGLKAGEADVAASDLQQEAARCLHCDCRKPLSCKLRQYAERYGADQRAYVAEERPHVQVINQHESVLFEPGKCVKCGLCVRLTRRVGEAFGLTFTGRGFHMRVAVPFGASLEEGLRRVARECVDACPTGALSFRNFEEQLIE
jgi:ferredoxin